MHCNGKKRCKELVLELFTTWRRRDSNPGRASGVRIGTCIFCRRRGKSNQEPEEASSLDDDDLFSSSHNNLFNAYMLMVFIYAY